MKYLFIVDSQEFKKEMYKFFPRYWKVYNDLIMHYMINDNEIYINGVTSEKIIECILKLPFMNIKFDKIFIITCTDCYNNMRWFLFQLLPLVASPEDLFVFKLTQHEKRNDFYKKSRTWKQACRMVLLTGNFRYLYAKPKCNPGTYILLGKSEGCNPDFFINYANEVSAKYIVEHVKGFVIEHVVDM